MMEAGKNISSIHAEGFILDAGSPNREFQDAAAPGGSAHGGRLHERQRSSDERQRHFNGGESEGEMPFQPGPPAARCPLPCFLFYYCPPCVILFVHAPIPAPSIFCQLPPAFLVRPTFLLITYFYLGPF